MLMMKLGENKWGALLAVTSAYSFSFLVRYIWSPVMMDAGAEFQINSTQMGLCMTAFMVGYLMMQLPGGILADRVYPKYLLMICVGAASICTLVFASVRTYGLGLGIRVIEGLSLGSIYPCCSKIVSAYFERKDRAAAMGILLASPPLGILLANSLGEPLNGLVGWRETMRIVAYMGGAVLLLLLLTVKRSKKPAVDSGKRGLLDGTRLYLRDRQQLLLAGGGMLSMFASVGFATWMNTYMKTELGYPGVKGGILLTVYSAVGIAATCVSGSVVKKFGWDPRKFVLILFAAAALCTAAFGVASSYAALMVLSVIYGIVVNLPSAYLAELCIRRAPGRFIGTMCALENLVMQFGAMAQSYLIGAAVDGMGSYQAIWGIFTAAGVLSVIMMKVYNPNEGMKRNNHE